MADRVKQNFTQRLIAGSGQEKIKILDFIEKIDYAFSAADLVICRSGITSIMEIA
ncbi:MAG: hypothetical protein IPG09_16330 [Ignavibacteria bacterium]|nr:hypothetical protein [Ignavibacteria bacterium]